MLSLLTNNQYISNAIFVCFRSAAVDSIQRLRCGGHSHLLAFAACASKHYMHGSIGLISAHVLRVGIYSQGEQYDRLRTEDLTKSPSVSWISLYSCPGPSFSRLALASSVLSTALHYTTYYTET